MEDEVEQSFRTISNLKIVLEEKKRLVGRLKEKVSRKVKPREKKVYCCTICEDEEYSSLE